MHKELEEEEKKTPPSFRRKDVADRRKLKGETLSNAHIREEKNCLTFQLRSKGR